MTHLITLKILLFPFLPLLFMLDNILALGVKDGDVGSSSLLQTHQADPLLFHLFLGQQIFKKIIYIYI